MQSLECQERVVLGIDRIFSNPYLEKLKGKKIGLITNQTGQSSSLVPSYKLFYENQSNGEYTLKAYFAPEHGLFGEGYAAENIEYTDTVFNIPIHSLHGNHRRPTKEMLKDIDTLIFDIQDIGSRSYTFASTLFYVLEEAAKHKIAVIVLDRPNPLGGTLIDGPMLEENLRSFIGYISVPYCHGMTIGELAHFFIREYKITVSLEVIPMKNWKRSMIFSETGLSWIPTSPYIPTAETSFLYPTTGLIGELACAHIGISTSYPFQIVGAPWIHAERFAQALNKQRLPGVHFIPWYFRPNIGKFAQKKCQGVFIVITDPKLFLPCTTQMLLMSVLKELYPKYILESLKTETPNRLLFIKACGTTKVLDILQKSKKPFSDLCTLTTKERASYLEKRQQVLLYE